MALASARTRAGGDEAVVAEAASGAETRQGYYSLLRWRTDPVRDEARNVGVVLVEEKGAFSAFKPAPLSAISAKLHEQGLLDAALVALGQQVDEHRFTLERLHALHESFHQS